MKPLVSIVIPSYNRQAKILRLIASIYNSTYPLDRLEVIVVDNVSTDGTVPAIQAHFPQVKVLVQTKNLYSAGARNVGLRAAQGDYVFCVDDDNVLHPTCILHLVEAVMADPQLGAVAPLMLNFDDEDTIWSAGGTLGKYAIPNHLYAGKRLDEVKLPSMITAVDYFPNAYLFTRAVIDQGIAHDTQLFPHNWAEQDVFQKIKQAGYQIATVTAAHEWHDAGYGGRITRLGADRTFDQARARIVFRRKYWNTPSSWLVFWGLLFPLSTAYYGKRIIMQKLERKRSLYKAYLKGTLAGVKVDI